VAIVQISRITNRKGNTENLPQLAGAELGWCVDSRRLFIGNGTLQEGAPIIGNTEILTEFSSITELSDYTYKDSVVGYTAQTGPNANDPVIRTVQQKLDDFADVRDFGAVGDGVADDTAAINRALYQLYCRESNTQVRRTLYFPAGTYRITETIIIPTYAKLIGEGADCTNIVLDTNDISSLTEYVARYGDSLQQTGANIGSNSATPPTNIEISSMTFQSLIDTDVFLVDRATQCWFDSVDFKGPITLDQIQNDDVVPLPLISAVSFDSSTALVTNTITFDKCGFFNITYGINTDADLQAVTVSNGRFYQLKQGVVLATNPSGVRIVHNHFDEIYAEGIYVTCELNITAHNIFYDVGNNIGSGSPITPVIFFSNDNCVSVSDLFARDAADNYDIPRIRIISTGSNASGGTLIQQGRYARENGRTFELTDGASSQTLFLINADTTRAFSMFYTIIRGSSFRHGTLTVTGGADDSTPNPVSYTDDYTENTETGITLSASQSTATISVLYSATSITVPGTLTYSINYLA
jgi:hypothetical protein